MSMDHDLDGLRHRRTKSVTSAEEIQEVELKVRKAQPDHPCHRPRDSLFSWTSGFDDFTGLVNWAFLLLSLGGFRLLLENFIKYGIRVDPLQWFYMMTGKDEGGSGYPAVILTAYVIVPVILFFLTEKGLAHEILPNGPGMAVHIVNLLVTLLIPMVAIHIKGENFSLVGATTVCFAYSVIFLKMWSYIHVNLWCRTKVKVNHKMRRQSLSSSNLKSNHKSKKSSSQEEINNQEGTLVHYPNNLNLHDLFYFLLAPTLCYELNFPRTSRIRKRFLFKRIVEVLVGSQLMMFMFQQYMIPSVKNSLIPFSNMDVAKATERLLKLAIPNHLTWLLFFYLTFHSLYNLIGEIMYFADRNFYCDWWNSNNVDTFWRTWNMPVHRWAVRHLYIPVVEMGYSRMLAGFIVFFLSAFFHEYLISIPLKTFKIWMFMGMMSQIPLATISKYMEKHYGHRSGNLVMWASLILGQPLFIMMYYHDYVITHFGEALIEEYGHV